MSIRKPVNLTGPIIVLIVIFLTLEYSPLSPFKPRTWILENLVIPVWNTLFLQVNILGILLAMVIIFFFKKIYNSFTKPSK